MCVCVCVCVCARARTRVHLCTRACERVCVCVCVFACVRACLYFGEKWDVVFRGEALQLLVIGSLFVSVLVTVLL